MVIFYSYVGSPEGTHIIWGSTLARSQGTQRELHLAIRIRQCLSCAAQGSIPATWEERKKREEIASRKLQLTLNSCFSACKMKMNLQISSGKPIGTIWNHDIPTCSKNVCLLQGNVSEHRNGNAVKKSCVSPLKQW